MATQTLRSAAQADFTFKISGLDSEDLRVVAFEGDEGLSRLFEYRIDLSCDNPALAYDSVLAKSCVLEIAGMNGSRFVHGMVRRFERTGQGLRAAHFSADVVPIHWMLTKRIRSRIFQEAVCSDMSVPGIIQKVFADAGIPTDSFRLALQASYEVRDYVVQYRESEMDFISRLMEEEGIFYFFEHTAEGHKMVIADGPVSHVASPIDPECTYREPTGLVPVTNTFYAFRESAEMHIGKVSLDDFDFISPSTDVRAEAAGDKFAALHWYDYPGGYTDKGRGQRLAQCRLEEQACRQRTATLTGDIRGLSAGQKFTLKEHPVAELNREYLVTHLYVRASQPQGEEGVDGSGETFDMQIRTIPADIPFRAPLLTPRPRIYGTQTAIVTGPSGEEIYTDEYGRVKVHFHWDLEGQHDENSSCWIRVSHGSAGGQYGMMFLPRVGQEVIIEFLEGDPDRPIITGRVYNNDHMPPYKLPDEMTKSVIKTNSSKGGGGTNEICFEDNKDGEKILIFAQKDFHLRVGNDAVQNIGHDHHLTVEQHAFELVKQKKHSEIKLDLNEKIGGKHSQKIVGDHGLEVGGNYSNKTTGKLYIKSDAEVVIEGASGVTLKVGGNFIKIDSSGVCIQGTQTKINSGGSAGSGTAVSLTAPEATIEADTTEPGADTTYSASAVEPDALAPDMTGFQPVELPPAEEKVTSWVEIELVDEEGQPWPDELYEITYPDGKKRRGKLDRNGQAHIGLKEPMDVQVTFPHLDSEAWERAGGNA